MWLLNFLPNYVFHILFLVGLIGSVAVLFPLPILYKSSIQIISIAILTFAIYMEGAISNQAKWQAKVAALQVEIAKKETISADITTEVITKYVDRIKIVKEKGNVIIKEIPTYINKTDDSKCVVPNGFVVLHDSASRNEVPDTARIVDERASKIKISGIAETVGENYNTYHEVAEQLKSLQKWVRDQQELFNKPVK